MVSKNLPVCLSVINFDPNYLRTGKTIDLSSNQNQKPLEKKFAELATRAFFVSQFLFQKQLLYDFLAGNNYPNSPHSQGGMKFLPQISPLHICYNTSKSIIANVGLN